MCRINKLFFIIGFFLSLFQIAHSTHRSLEDEIALGYRNFCTRRYEEPALAEHYVHSAVRYVYHLQAELDGTADRGIAKKLRNKIFEILTYGTGVGGIDLNTEASEIEKKIMLGAFYEVCKGSAAAKDGVVDGFSISDLKTLTSHQRILYSVYQASKDINFYISHTNLVQHPVSYKQLQDYIIRDNPYFAQGFDSPIPVDIDLTDGNEDTSGSARPNATATLSSDRQQPSRTPSQPEKVEWSTVNAKVLSSIYETKYGKPLINGYRISSGQRFPLDLVTSPAGWTQLIERCADSRETSNLPKDAIQSLEDVFADIADQLGWLGGGKDSSDAGRQMRNIVSQMGQGEDQGKTRLNNLGYRIEWKKKGGWQKGKYLDF